MAAVSVTKESAPAKREGPPTGRFYDFPMPMFPISRLFGRRPFELWRTISEEMDRAFGAAPKSREEFWTPLVDVRKCEGNLVVTAELPGLRKEDIKVELTGDALLIEGERRSEHKEDDDGYHRTERSYGRFYRSIPLPEGAKTDQIKAELADGVLKVSVPVPETKKEPRRIPVEARAGQTVEAAAPGSMTA